MSLPDHRLLLGMTIGAVCAMAVASIGPGVVMEALADEFAPTGIDAANLVKFEGHDYQVDYQDWVATDPTSTVRVKKIEGGRVSYVTITTTATGTYSTDAMFSRHVQYPGIEVTPVRQDENVFQFWGNGEWSTQRSGNAGSISFVGFGQH